MPEMWTCRVLDSGEKGVGCFSLCQCHQWQKGHLPCPAAGASSVGRSRVVWAALSGTQGSGDVMLSVPGVFQIPFSFQRGSGRWKLPQLSAQSAWVLAEGVGEEGSPRERSPWQGLGSPVLPNLRQPSLVPPHSLVTAFDPPVIQPLPFGEHPVMGSLTGAGGRGTPWGSVKAERGRVGHKTRCKPRELRLRCSELS